MKKESFFFQQYLFFILILKNFYIYGMFYEKNTNKKSIVFFKKN